jgi:integrase
MGWSGGTDMFKRIWNAFVDVYQPSLRHQFQFAESLIEILTDEDWDTVDELEHHSSAAVRAAYHKWVEQYDEEADY